VVAVIIQLPGHNYNKNIIILLTISDNNFIISELNLGHYHT